MAPLQLRNPISRFAPLSWFCARCSQPSRLRRNNNQSSPAVTRKLLLVSIISLLICSQLLGNAPITSGPYAENRNVTSEHSLGVMKTLVIRADFPDLAETRTLTTYQSVMAQVRARYQRDSYNKTDLDVTVTAKCYRLPQTSVYYATLGTGTQEAGWTAIMYDAQTLAAADYPVDPNTGGIYERVVLAFPGISKITGSKMDGLHGSFGTKWLWMNGAFEVGNVTHELGHTYGSLHGGLWQVTDGNPISANGKVDEIGDLFDAMGNNGSSDYSDFNPWVKNHFGWITNDQVTTVTQSGIYRVYRFDHQLATGVLALKVVRNSTQNYWISIRRRVSIIS